MSLEKPTLTSMIESFKSLFLLLILRYFFNTLKIKRIESI